MATRAKQFEFLLSGLVDPLTGSPLTGGTVEFYVTGTGTAKSVWTEPEKTNAYSSITLAAGGVYQIYGEGIYRVVVKRSDGTTIWTWENIKIEAINADVQTIIEDTAQTSDHDFILVDTSSGNVNYTLLPAASWNRPVFVKNIGSNSVVVVGTIDGATNYTITTENQAIMFISNGSNIYKANDVADTITGLTASVTELNQLDDVEVGGTSAGDIITTNGTQTLTNKTLTSPKINEDVELSVTATELNQLDDYTLFAAGTVMLFGNNSAPTGWTRKTDWQNGAMLALNCLGDLSSGGSTDARGTHSHAGPSHTHTGPSHTHVTNDHTLSVGELPAHTHGITGYMASGGSSVGVTTTNTGATNSDRATSSTGSGSAHNHGNTNSGGTGNTGSSGTDSTGYNTQPYYQDVIAATKD